MDVRIEKFIKRHHVMTLATQLGGQPWVCQVFYVYVPEERVFVFTSSCETRHILEGLASDRVAISVVLESKLVARLQGLQVEGVLFGGSSDHLAAFSRRFPLIPLKLETMWAVRVVGAKYTDNTLGFGTKLHYPLLEPAGAR